METKTCKKCNINKSVNDFHFQYKKNNIRLSTCKICIKINSQKPEVKERKKQYRKEYNSRPEIIEHNKKYNEEYFSKPEVKERMKKYTKEYIFKPEIKEHVKQYRSKPEVKERVKEYIKEYRSKPEVKERVKQYRSKPEVKERDKEYSKKYYSKPEVKKHIKEYAKEYRNKNKIRCNLQNRLSNLPKSNGYKSKTLKKYIGCSYEFFLKWIEFQLYDGMTMENYGKVWHMDHVKPCSIFDHNNEEKLKECWNWSNLRPLLKHKNLVKQNIIDHFTIMLQELKAYVFKHISSDF